MTNVVGLLVGGLLPALVFGIGAIFQKHSNDIGLGHSYYLLYFACGMLLASIAAYLIFPENVASQKAGVFAAGHGALFGIGFVSLAIGLTIYQIPVAKLVPLANMSTLVAVILGLVIFNEHTKVNLFYLLPGSLLIVIGGILVGRA